MWPKEGIPDEDRLYYRVHITLARDGLLSPSVFRQQGDSMSTDWERYSTPNATRNRARQPTSNGVVSLVAGRVRQIGLSVEHSPDPATNNRAHTDVFGLNGPKKAEFRLRLYEQLNGWEIEPSAPAE